MSSLLASSSPIQNMITKVTEPEVTRRSADFHPSIWGDHFMSYSSNSVEHGANSETNWKNDEMLKEIRSMILSPVENTLEKLELIDAVQRLGVSYHFEEEIELVLRKLHDNKAVDCKNGNEDVDLYCTSLGFRLLRQQGYNVSCEIFSKFKNNEGKLKESLSKDVRGMLSLYEASFFRVHGEDVLEEALAFTSSHLKSMASENMIESPFLIEKVTHALKQPLRKGLTRVEARHFMSVYQQEPSHLSALLNFSKLDFNLLQKLHQEELSQITRWWKELDFARKLPFARDRITECYFWILGVYFEPQYSFARLAMTRVIAMTSVIDDIYDVYGELEELELFNEAVQRWDISTINQLPDYMKCCYKALLDVYAEIEEKILVMETGKLYCVNYAKEAMKRQVGAYFQEAKWFHTKYVPNLEEYMSVALVTSAYSMLATTSFVGIMGDIVTKDSFEWVLSKPKIVEASEIICRLMDDIVSNKFEQKRGHIVSAVECYMNQHGGTEEEVIDELRKQVSSAWKDVNKECLYPNNIVPMPLLMRIVNLSRVIDVVYTNEDGYTHSGGVLKEFITSILVDPLSELA